MAVSALALAGTGASAAVPVACTASGGKFVAMSDAQICARFVTAFGAAMRAKTMATTTRPVDGYTVELRFLPQGVASATVARLRAGRAQDFPAFQLAVSDRKMLGTDIDKLATDAARGIALAKPVRRG